MRTGLVVLWMLLCSITSAAAQVSIGIGLPGVSIGFSLPMYPQLVPVPGYPVYYAPQVNSNYFFYDGMYWLYQRDNWYASSWYNGPWQLVAPEAVPLFVLRVPVRYYRRPPAYFHGWRSDAPPHWGDHWGNAWAQRRAGWDNWDRSSVPPPAPLPVYQRQYSGNRYPAVEQQQVLQSQNYRYQPRDAVVQQHYQTQQGAAPVPPTAQPQARPPQQGAAQRQQEAGKAQPQARPPQQGAAQRQQEAGKAQPQARPPQQGAAQRQQEVGKAQPQAQQPQQGATQHQQEARKAQPQAQQPQQRAAPREQQAPKAQPQAQQPQQQAAPREQQASRSQGQDKGAQGKEPAQEPKQGQEKGHEKGDQQGGERK